MTTLKIASQSNFVGAVASSLCLVHCVATPFLFAVHTGHLQGHHPHPLWWGFMDILFLVISFFAVWWSVRNTSKYWMKFALWVSWALLAMIVMNEKIQLIPLAEALIYVPSLALIVLHLYNRKYCRCENDDCCVEN